MPACDCTKLRTGTASTLWYFVAGVIVERRTYDSTSHILISLPLDRAFPLPSWIIGPDFDQLPWSQHPKIEATLASRFTAAASSKIVLDDTNGELSRYLCDSPAGDRIVDSRLD